MDASEATKIVMTRIQSLDPENASRIMGYILIQDQAEKEMIRLAFGPDGLLLSYVNQAKAYLALHSSNPLSNRNNFFRQSPPQVLIPNKLISYAAVVNGSASGSLTDSRLHFYAGNDEFVSDIHSIMSPSGLSDNLVSSPHHNHHPFHRRCHSLNDGLFLSNPEERGFERRPCMYFAKGYCKNGSDCKFFHGDIGGDEMIEMGSPSTNGSGVDEFLRMKGIHQQRLALMASGGHRPCSYNKINENQRYGPRNEALQMGIGAAMASSSRQIYLTFPSDSMFKEEDVSSYFSMFGPVHDVRIPYQQKRMFGFVTFVYPETVKLILAKGNPHYVCDSRVLVKPYKEKGTVPDKQQHQYLERGEYSSCISPSGIDSDEFFDPFMGSRMLSNAQEMMLRRKLEQEVELQHAIELQSQRMTNLQLMDLKYQQHNHRFLSSLPAGVPTSSSRMSQLLMGKNVVASSEAGSQDVLQEFDNGQETSKSLAVTADDDEWVMEGTKSSIKNYSYSSDKHQHFMYRLNDSHLPESLEHILPDNLFSSPTKSSAEQQSIFSLAPIEAGNPLTTDNSPMLPSSSPLGMATIC